MPMNCPRKLRDPKVIALNKAVHNFIVWRTRYEDERDADGWRQSELAKLIIADRYLELLGIDTQPGEYHCPVEDVAP